MLRYDEVGYWSEIKLEILREYAKAYSRILANQPGLHHVYIDAFAGPGLHISKASGEFIKGSPTIALEIEPKFSQYHLIDLDADKAASLRDLAERRDNVFIYHGDCNKILMEKIIPQIRYENYKRALCILDPYGLHLNWEIIRAMGQAGTFDIFLNFPIADMNRNVLWHDSEKVTEEQKTRMDAFWGDRSWRDCCYGKRRDLFGFMEEKNKNDQVAESFRQRLLTVAGFHHVPKPLAMKNSMNATVYYLFFAARKAVASKILTDIFDKYQHWRV